MGAFEERQQKKNERYYKQWLACGFTGEMPINEYGWFVPVLRLHCNVENIQI